MMADLLFLSFALLLTIALIVFAIKQVDRRDTYKSLWYLLIFMMPIGGSLLTLLIITHPSYRKALEHQRKFRFRKV